MASTSFGNTLVGVQGTQATGVSGVGTTASNSTTQVLVNGSLVYLLTGPAAITAGTAFINSVTSNTAYVLPFAAAGTTINVYNNGSAAALVFPATSAGRINAVAAAGSFSVTNAKSAQFVNIDGNDNWVATLSA